MSDISLRTPGAVIRAAPSTHEPSLLALSLWLRALFIGASLAVVGVVSAFEAPAHTTGMLVLGVAGAALTILSYERARALVRALDRKPD